MQKIGLVTVLYKSDTMLEGFFKSLSEQSYANYILYLVDNSPSAETDLVIAKVSKAYPLKGNCIHIKNINNDGAAKANNTGIKKSLEEGCEFVLLLNNDIEFYQPKLIEEMVSYAIRQKENIVFPKICFLEHKDIIWMAGGRFDKYRALTPHIGEGEKDSDIYSRPGYFGYAPTTFMLLHKKVFETIGSMDENYFIYYEDSDLVYRAVAKKLLPYYLPEWQVYHKVGHSTGVLSLTYIYYYNMNRLYFIIKNLGFFYKLAALFFYAGSRIKSFFKFDAAQRKMQWKGIVDGIKLCFKKRAIYKIT